MHLLPQNYRVAIQRTFSIDHAKVKKHIAIVDKREKLF